MRMHLLEETTVRTEWTRAPGPVDAYEIQFIPTTEGVSPPFTARVPSSASAYDQRGLAPGQDYQVTVRALRGTSWGPPTSKTITTMIDGPQDLQVVAVTPTTLDLSWLRPQAEVDRFVVSYVSAGNQRVRLEVPPEADRTQLTDLMPGVEYVVTVTAERGHAVSYPASIRANTGMAVLVFQVLGKSLFSETGQGGVLSLGNQAGGSEMAGAIPEYLLQSCSVLKAHGRQPRGAWSPI